MGIAQQHQGREAGFLGFTDLRKLVETQTTSKTDQIKKMTRPLIVKEQDFDASNPVRTATLLKLEAKITHSDQCLKILKIIAHFFLSYNVRLDHAQQLELRKILNEVWPLYFKLGGTASALYDGLQLAKVDYFSANYFQTRVQELSWKLEKEQAIQPVLALWWSLAHSYDPGGLNQRVVLQALCTILLKESESADNENIVFEFCVTALRKLTGISDDLTHYAHSWLAQASLGGSALPLHRAKKIPDAFTPVALIMMGVIEKRADQSLATNPKTSTELLFLLVRYNFLAEAEQRRLAAKTAKACEKWSTDKASETDDGLLKFCINCEFLTQGIMVPTL